MPLVKDLPQCDIFGCLNPQHENETVNSGDIIPEWTPAQDLKICLYHQSVLADGTEKYIAGITYRNELEIRPVAKKPFVTPETPDE